MKQGVLLHWSLLWATAAQTSWGHSKDPIECVLNCLPKTWKR